MSTWNRVPGLGCWWISQNIGGRFREICNSRYVWGTSSASLIYHNLYIVQPEWVGMECPGCGRYIQRGSTVCHYCGLYVVEDNGKEKKLTRKHGAALFLILIVGGSLFHFFQYETESADRLVRAARKERETGSELLQTVEAELKSLREVQLETQDHFLSEMNYASQSRERIRTVLLSLDAAVPALERADIFLEKCEELRIPDWYRSSVELEQEIVQKYREYCSVLEILSSNYSDYYKFAEYFLEGEQLMVSAMDNMDRGNDHLERGDYTFAYAAYQTARDQVIEAQTAYGAAVTVVDLSYLHDLISNVDHIKRALSSLSEAAHQMDMQNTEQASLLTALGMQEMELLVELNRLHLKMQVAQWVDTTITAYIEQLEQLQSEIEQGEKEAAASEK
jgi:hypothetical protein